MRLEKSVRDELVGIFLQSKATYYLEWIKLVISPNDHWQFCGNNGVT